MIGALAGDIAGSIYEWDNIKTKDFELFSGRCTFTDDSVLTVALADSILTGTPYAENLKAYYRRYPDRGYGAASITGPASRAPRPTTVGATGRRCG